MTPTGWTLASLSAAAACAACAPNAPASRADEQHIASVVLAVPASPDSTLRLARFALGEIDGAVQLPDVRSNTTTLAKHYFRSSRRGEMQVAILATVAR